HAKRAKESVGRCGGNRFSKNGRSGVPGDVDRGFTVMPEYAESGLAVTHDQRQHQPDDGTVSLRSAAWPYRVADGSAVADGLDRGHAELRHRVPAFDAFAVLRVWRVLALRSRSRLGSGVATGDQHAGHLDLLAHVLLHLNAFA